MGDMLVGCFRVPGGGNESDFLFVPADLCWRVDFLD
jgi:hypothetical protein